MQPARCSAPIGLLEPAQHQPEQRLGGVRMLGQRQDAGPTRRRGVERQQERVVVRRRPQAVDELGAEADDHGAAVEAVEVDHVVELQVVDDEQVAGREVELALAHPEERAAFDRHEQLEPLVPGRAARVQVGAVVEQRDGERELVVERHLVAAAGVELRGDVVRHERQARAGLDERVPGSWPAPRRRARTAAMVSAAAPRAARSRRGRAPGGRGSRWRGGDRRAPPPGRAPAACRRPGRRARPREVPRGSASSQARGARLATNRTSARVGFDRQRPHRVEGGRRNGRRRAAGEGASAARTLMTGSDADAARDRRPPRRDSPRASRCRLRPRRARRRAPASSRPEQAAGSADPGGHGGRTRPPPRAAGRDTGA